MWRINGVQYYRYILLTYIFVQIGLLVTAGSVVALEPFNASINSVLPSILISAIVITVFMLASIVIYIVVFQTLSDRLDKRYEDNHRKWLEIWTQAYFQKTPPEHVEVTMASAKTLLELIDVLPSDDTAILQTWATEYGIIAFWESRLRSINLHQQIDALEAFATVGTLNHLPEIFELARRNPQLRSTAAMLTISTLIPRIPDDAQDDNIKKLADIIITREFPVVTIESVFAQLEDNMTMLIDCVLADERITTPVLIATINTIGQFYLANYVEELGQYVHNDDPTIRRVTLKAFSNLQSIPKSSYYHIINSIHDEDVSVREQAVMTLATIPLYHSRLPLWLALGDDEWVVRFATAQVLTRVYGNRGFQTLQIASQTHQTEVGRQLATEMLQMNEAI